MGKAKKSKAKESDIDKLIGHWEEKLSIAEVNKNKQEVASINRMLDFYKKKKASS